MDKTKNIFNQKKKNLRKVKAMKIKKKKMA